jgi:hypothetical protein
MIKLKIKQKYLLLKSKYLNACIKNKWRTITNVYIPFKKTEKSYL